MENILEIYNNLYDYFTISECRGIERIYLQDELPEEQIQTLSDEDQKTIKIQMARLMTYIIAGERHLNKSETIQEWTNQKDFLNIRTSSISTIDKNYYRDKQRFCLSSEEGIHYKNFKEKLNNFDRFFNELGEKKKLYSKKYYLTIGQLQEFLMSILTKECNIFIEFPKVEFYNSTTLYFSIFKQRGEQNDTDYKTTLQRCINLLLQNTDWKLIENRVDESENELVGRLENYFSTNAL